MAKGEKPLYNGPLQVDVSAHAGKLVDLPENGKKGLTREKPDFDDMLGELLNAKDSKALDKIGVAESVVTRIEERTTTIQAFRKLKPIVKKLAEVLEESEAYEEDEREADIAVIAKAVQTTVQHKDPNVAATFEKLLRYYSQIADKGVATRRKNAEAKAESEEIDPTK